MNFQTFFKVTHKNNTVYIRSKKLSKKTFYATLSCVKTPENQVTKKVKNANLLYP